MRPLLDIDGAREQLHQELLECLQTAHVLTAGDVPTLDIGIERLRQLRRAISESINQIQHEGLLLQAALWLKQQTGLGCNTFWEWNPRQTGTADEPDLRGRVDGCIVVSAEATASEDPKGILDTRMRNTLAKLALMEGKRYYFVRTESMARRARGKIASGGYAIEVISL